jgi:N-acetylmuramoyl-L-alanine amidase
MSDKPQIILDPGHGGHDSGAVGPTGLKEKDVVLSVARRLEKLLAPHMDVRKTRSTDRFLELHERAALANKLGCQLFLSIHCNSGPPGQGDGFEVFTTPGETPADRFATALFIQYGRRFPGKRKRVDDRDGDPDKEASFAVLRLSNMPACLMELEFIHTVEGERWLREEANHDRMAEALADGIFEHLGLQEIEKARHPLIAVTAVPAQPVVTRTQRIRELAQEILTLTKE